MEDDKLINIMKELNKRILILDDLIKEEKEDNIKLLFRQQQIGYKESLKIVSEYFNEK
ncbi:hypothetical protein [uncultured Clostridium sp.]|uniref:hypothetical protein n=1 Tax=uncultured Clostridium sp. TaxID=59620 RepID=UPI003217D6D6